jgi:membrane fusion protein YbhG
MHRRIVMGAVLAGVVAVAAAATVACGSLHKNAGLVASGHIEAVDVRILTKVRGRLLERRVDEGDPVKKGDVIAVLDTIDNTLQLTQAEAERAAADANLRLKIAGARKQDIDQLQAQVEAAAATLDGAEKELSRQQGLIPGGFTTVQARDNAEALRDTYKGQLDAAKQALSRAKAGSRVQEIDMARAQRDSADARVAQLKQMISDATIVSPVAGVVTEKIAEPGELLEAGSAVLVVTDLAQPWLTVYVPEPDLGRVKIGAPAEVVTDGGERRQGKVTFVASQAEFTPKNVQTRDERVKLVFRVKVGLDNPDGLFKPGMPAEAHF